MSITQNRGNLSFFRETWKKCRDGGGYSDALVKSPLKAA